MKKYYQRSRTRFLSKYGGLSLYDIYMEKRYSIEDKETHFVKGDGYSKIGNPDHSDGTQLIMNIFSFMMICLTEY